jgi:hypothetical protein
MPRWYSGPDGKRAHYRKINLAMNELRATIDTAATSDWYLGQRRTDVVEVRYLSGT